MLKILAFLSKKEDIETRAFIEHYERQHEGMRRVILEPFRLRAQMSVRVCDHPGHLGLSFSRRHQSHRQRGVRRRGWVGPRMCRCYCATNPYRPLKGPSASVEDKEVTAYFVGAGMPTAQLGSLGHTYRQNSSGADYTLTLVSRVVGGIPVPDSYAFASLIHGLSESEAVFWPELPASVRHELAALQAIVADPKSLADFQAKLPSGFLSGSIVIHHTCVEASVPGHPGEELKLEAHACYDALIQSGEFGQTSCYLADGTRFVFPSPC
jgi:hypothetical protein